MFRGAPAAPPPPWERDRKKSERRSADVKVRGSRSADVKVWRCRSADVKVWRCRSADVKVWRCRSADVRVWRCRSADVRLRRCRSADVRLWRCRSADVKVWRCIKTAAFLRRTLRRRSREKLGKYCLAKDYTGSKAWGTPFNCYSRSLAKSIARTPPSNPELQGIKNA